MIKETLFEKKTRLKIRNKFKNNIRKRYGKYSSQNLEAAHIFGIREAKYMELFSKIDFHKLEKILVLDENCILLSNYDHKQFNKNEISLPELSKIQTELLDCRNMIFKTKFRTKNEKIIEIVENKLSCILKKS